MSRSQSSTHLLTALSRWETEGGAAPGGPQEQSDGHDNSAPPTTDTEIVQLRIRMIALENLVIALLAERSSQQLGLARDIADLIAPRPESFQHPLTIRASAHMIDLIERSQRFRNVVPH